MSLDECGYDNNSNGEYDDEKGDCDEPGKSPGTRYRCDFCDNEFTDEEILVIPWHDGARYNEYVSPCCHKVEFEVVDDKKPEIHNVCNICGTKFTDEEMLSVFNTEYGCGGPVCEDRVSPCCSNFNYKNVEDES